MNIHWNKVAFCVPVMFCDIMMMNCVTPQNAAMPSIESLSMGFDHVEEKLRMGERSLTNSLRLLTRMVNDEIAEMSPIPDSMKGSIE